MPGLGLQWLFWEEVELELVVGQSHEGEISNASFLLSRELYFDMLFL